MWQKSEQIIAIYHNEIVMEEMVGSHAEKMQPYYHIL